MQGPEDDPRVLCGYQNTGVPLRLFPISLDAQVDVFMVQERKVLQLELLISRLTILVLQSSMRIVRTASHGDRVMTRRDKCCKLYGGTVVIDSTNVILYGRRRCHTRRRSSHTVFA
jgi:hypothetical protein